MDSPDAVAKPSSAAAAAESPQDSPFLNFASTLSPIQPVDTRPAAFVDVNFPSPEPVFKTPHTNHLRKLDLLRRCEQLPSPSHNPKLFSEVVPPVSSSMAQLNTCCGKECEGDESLPQDRPCSSPSTCVDAFLVEPSEDCENPSGSRDASLEEASKLSQINKSEVQIDCRQKDSGPVRDLCSNSPSLHLDQDSGGLRTSQSESISTKEIEMKIPASTTKELMVEDVKFSYQAEQPLAGLKKSSNEEHLGKPDKQKEVKVIPHTEELQPVLKNAIKGDGSSVERGAATLIQGHRAQDVKLHTGSGQWGESSCNPQFLPQPNDASRVVDSYNDSCLAVSVVSAENQTLWDQEDGAAQCPRGMRKRLQFEAVENNQKLSSWLYSDLTDSTDDVSNAESQLHLDKHSVNASDEIPIVNSSKSETFLHKSSANVNRGGQKKATTVRMVPRPSGIGLHLNSVASIGLSSEKSLTNPGIASIKEENQDNPMLKLPENSSSYQSPLDVEPLRSSQPSKCTDIIVTPINVKSVPAKDASRSEESSKMSPRKKRCLRKKAPEDEGHKRCNCKRSKCLKLYCDCFAAGAFCSEACACLECSNRSEYQDTIREAKQQIESRNPLAFAPKVVLRVTQQNQENEENKGVTPPSARHKRGCNCKKSLCLKKYCECYQAGVGCSFGCRCEGCKNTYGRKDGCGELIEIEHKKPVEREEKDLSAGKLRSTGVNMEVINTSQRLLRLSPVTPSIQGSNSGNNVPKSHKLPSSYHTSPESGALVLPYYVESPSSPTNSMSINTFEEAREELSMIPYDQDQALLKLDSFSPGWDGFPDICNLSPLTSLSPSTTHPSSSKIKEPKIIQKKVFPWRSSPATPLPHFAERKIFSEPDSESVLPNIREDDIPQEISDERLPIKSVQASSPKQKRVSPPQRRLHGTRSSSSPSLRSGRKFILQSVPSFPPLTPYSKNNRGQGS
ncbi:uncharacterized protein LOC109710949 isoform X3 [Ananas comosus]|uniref:Uncharacterized protein LOC109710949 isoform X3 n=1 Tax=Ananas comosus TaxID=4615 RepID=A0A6P5F0U5_ANACO|nr:uncharacterized protein LOC109710949 isoform X3 [Ananas comosus]